MILNPVPYATDYVRTLDKPSPYDDEPRSYTIREHKPRNLENPNTDYKKLLLMVVGAVATGYLYDKWREHQLMNNPDVFDYEEQEPIKALMSPTAPANASRVMKSKIA